MPFTLRLLSAFASHFLRALGERAFFHFLAPDPLFMTLQTAIMIFGITLAFCEDIRTYSAWGLQFMGPVLLFCLVKVAWGKYAEYWRNRWPERARVATYGARD